MCQLNARSRNQARRAHNVFNVVAIELAAPIRALPEGREVAPVEVAASLSSGALPVSRKLSACQGLSSDGNRIGGLFH